MMTTCYYVVFGASSGTWTAQHGEQVLFTNLHRDHVQYA